MSQPIPGNERRERAATRLRRNAFKAAKAFAAQLKAAIESCAHLANQPLEYKRTLDEKIAGIPPLRHRGKGRGTVARNHLRPCNNGGAGKPHQGMQERLRRVSGGFARMFNETGMHKAAAVAHFKAVLA